MEYGTRVPTTDIINYFEGYEWNVDLIGELTATPAPTNNNERERELGTRVPIATDINNCLEGNEFGTGVPITSDISDCFEITKRERESEYDKCVANTPHPTPQHHNVKELESCSGT